MGPDPGRVSAALRLAGWIVVLAATTYIMAVGGTYNGIASAPDRVLMQALAYGILGTWCIGAMLRPSWRPRTPLLFPVVLASAVYGLSALFSQRPRLSLDPTMAGFAIALTYLLLSRILADSWFRRRFEPAMVTAVGLVCAAYIVQVVLEWLRWWGLVGALVVPPLRPSFVGLGFGSPNLVATFLLLLGPLAVVVVGRSSRTWPAVALGAAVAVAIFLTGSRGAYIGVAVAMFVAVGLAATRREFGRPLADKANLLFRRRRSVLALSAICVLVLVVFTPVVVSRFLQGGDSLRIDLWRSAASIFVDHPLFGGGPGTWVQLKIPANPPGTSNIIVAHAHNMYIQAAAELGLVGLAALLFLVIATGRRLLGAWRSAPVPLSVETGAVIVGLSAFAGQSLVDNLVNLPFVCLLVIGVVAWVDAGMINLEASGTNNRSVDHTVSRLSAVVLPVAALVASVLVLPFVIRTDAAMFASEAGALAGKAGDWPTALADYGVATSLDPGFALHRLERASALARTGRLAEAREETLAASKDDQTAIILASLAALDQAAGDLAAANEHVRRAVTFGTNEPNVALNAGLIGEAIGDRAFALDQFANAVAWDPPLAGNAFWVLSKRAVSKADVLALARERSDPETAALIRAYGGEPRTARRELEALGPSAAHDVLIAAAIWLGGDAVGAKARLRELLQKDPHDWFAAAWMARIARLSGDGEGADRYAQWAVILQADVAPLVITELSTIPAGPGDEEAGMPFDYPWAIYLRPTPPYLLAPQLTLIGRR